MYEYTTEVFSVGLEGLAAVDTDKLGDMAAEGWEPSLMTPVHNGFATLVLFRRATDGSAVPGRLVAGAPKAARAAAPASPKAARAAAASPKAAGAGRAAPKADRAAAASPKAGAGRAGAGAGTGRVRRTRPSH